MSHAHHHHVPIARKLAVAAGANLMVVAGEIAVGLWTGSLALIGDALHNLTDTAALLIAFGAIRLARRPPTSGKSFGYQRAGVLAAFINAGLLIAFTLFILREAWTRLFTNHPVATAPMIVVATIALAVNAATAAWIHHDSQEDVNIRGAFVHMVGDAVSSAGIIVAAIAIRMTGAPQWDAMVSMFIGVLIFWSSYGVLRESVNLLLEGTPAGIDPQSVIRSLAGIDGILGVHHMHIWALGPSSPALSCHLMVGDVPLRSTARMLEEINATLLRDFRISHTTIQFELTTCPEDDPFCVQLRK